ncbi:flavoprotein [Glycomyces sp. NPDC048151]|uniref:flavoprotein n=1 Tax=Glycomyces sp. NPDC048151 TaxID=3364002 RepID=UPI00371B2D0A
MTATRTVYLIVCAAPPAGDAETFVRRAIESGCECHVIGTPSAEGFMDVAALEEASGHPVTFQHRRPGSPRRNRPEADAAVIAPATANTVNRLAVGFGGNYALDLASELIGLHIPIAVVPFVNTALAERAPFKRSVASLREEGVKVLLDEEGSRPHPPHGGAAYREKFPWEAALAAVANFSG